MAAVVSLRATVPDDAFTAETLGTERAGQGVVIRDDGLVVTIGYLIAEAEEVWLTTNKGRVVQAHVLAYDYESGFGLVQSLEPLGVPVLALGRFPSPVARRSGRDREAAAGSAIRSPRRSSPARNSPAIGNTSSTAAVFTAPAHPNWGGTALIGPRGDLVGIGSLQLQHQASGGAVVPLNMSVPIDLLKPILDDLLTRGQVKEQAAPLARILCCGGGGR